MSNSCVMLSASYASLSLNYYAIRIEIKAFD